MDVHQCQCPHCVAGALDHPDRDIHRRLNLLLARLDEQQRRWLAALESQKIGHGGDRLVSLITGLNVGTIRRGRRELDASLRDCPPGRVRRPGAGRPALKKKIRTLLVPCAPWSKSKPPAAP
jgi:hypothetical protein